MGDALLTVTHLMKRFGGVVATADLSLEVLQGETHALIGPNGAGKTTLLAQLQGELRPDSGAIHFGDRDVTAEPAHRRAALGIARSFQITSVFPQFSVLENTVLAVLARSGHGFRFLRPALSQPSLFEPAREAIDTIGLAARSNVAAAALSHGERRQLELAMALAMKPRLLLLDEPMAGMGRQDGARLTGILAGLKRHYTILLVEHDMEAVKALADRVSVLVAGRTIATGTFAVVRGDPLVRSAYLGHNS